MGCWSIQRLHRIFEPKSEEVVFIKKRILSMTLLHTGKMYKLSCI